MFLLLFLNLEFGARNIRLTRNCHGRYSRDFLISASNSVGLVSWKEYGADGHVSTHTVKNYLWKTNGHPNQAGSISWHSRMPISILGWMKILPRTDSNPAQAGFFLRFLTDYAIIKIRKSYIVGQFFFHPCWDGFLSGPAQIYIRQTKIHAMGDC